MSWGAIERELFNDIWDIHLAIKDLAPQNSKYTSRHRGKTVNYIFVDNVKTYTNTNNLFNSVQLKERSSSNSHDKTYVTFVSSGKVPYYEKAVLRPTLPIAYHSAKIEYGKYRVQSSWEEEIENRNYMYYMKAQGRVKNMISKWDGKVFKVKESIGGYL